MNPLCKEVDSQGKCTKCYENFVSIAGSCFYQNQITDLSLSLDSNQGFGD